MLHEENAIIRTLLVHSSPAWEVVVAIVGLSSQVVGEGSVLRFGSPTNAMISVGGLNTFHVGISTISKIQRISEEIRSIGQLA
jgi:xanthosine utilization system XapX-like protein